MKLNAISMLKTFPLWGLFGLLLLLPVSCIRDDLQPCPPLSVQLVVKDKNYFNVKHVEGLEMPKLEGMPFQAYVPTLYYRLQNAETGECVCEQGLFDVTEADTAYQIVFPEELPHGKYELTVWGGLKDLTSLSDDRTALTLHPCNEEGEDVYLAHSFLEYSPYVSSHQLGMERTKGKLIVDIVNMPSVFSRVTESLEGYRAEVDRNLTYKGRTAVKQDRNISYSPKVVVKALLSPSEQEGKSLLSLRLFDENGKDLVRYDQKNLAVPMRRNNLTALKLIYRENGDCTILIMIDDSWSNIHDMIID